MSISYVHSHQHLNLLLSVNLAVNNQFTTVNSQLSVMGNWKQCTENYDCKNEGKIKLGSKMMIIRW